MKNNTQTVPYEGMKEIWSIACKDWKKKIKSWTKVFEDTILTNNQVEEMFKAADNDQKKILKKYLKQGNSEINGWEDILAYHGVKEFILPYKNPENKEEKSANALILASKIAQAYNKGEELSWQDRSKNKYMPYRYFDGGSWSWVDAAGWYASANVPAGLCFVRSQDSIAAHELFTQVYDDFYMFIQA